MSPPALLITGAVLILISISVVFAYIGYRQIGICRIKHQAQHPSWPRQNNADIELRPVQTRPKQTAAYSGWPRSLRDEQGNDTKFISAHTFAISRWNDMECKTSLQCPDTVRISFGHRRGDGNVQVPAREKTSADSEKTESSLPYDAGERGSNDPVREIWRGIEAQNTLDKRTDSGYGHSELGKSGVADGHTSGAWKQCPLSDTAAPSQRAGTEEDSRVDRATKRYAEVAGKLCLGSQLQR